MITRIHLIYVPTEYFFGLKKISVFDIRRYFSKKKKLIYEINQFWWSIFGSNEIVNKLANIRFRT